MKSLPGTGIIATKSSMQSGRPMMRAALWLLLLGPFFFLSYGFANWWTDRLQHVPSLWFEWERHIPFLECTIWPYMSIDVFYAVSLFVCGTKAELDRHASRLLMATIISVACFLLFPWQFHFIRPAVSGVNGTAFALLSGFDKPFNQAPSLHISLLILLWIVYTRHLKDRLRHALHCWIVLIGISVFTTYQHHVIDGVTGLIVAIVCLYAIPEPPRGWKRIQLTRCTARRTLSLRYGGASVAVLALAVIFGGWAWLLVWPATALALVSIAYAAIGVAVFQKNRGRISRPARYLLLPYQVLAWWSSRWLTRNDRPHVEIVPGIWLGRMPDKQDWKSLAVQSVLDLTAEFHCDAMELSFHYRNVPMLDLCPPGLDQIDAAVAALDELPAPVLVHCALGYSRSAVVVAAWLCRSGNVATVEEAVAFLRSVRPRIVLPPSCLS